MEKYQLTKTIRFKLEPLQNALSTEVKVLEQNSDKSEDINELHKLAKKLARNVELYLFIKAEEGKQTESSDQKPVLNGQLEIKKNWLKQYTKEHYYDWNSDKREARVHRITRVSYLQYVLPDWKKNWSNLIQKLDELIRRPEENQARRAEFALLIAEFSRKDHFRFIRDFIRESQDKSCDKIRNELIRIVAQVEQSLSECEQQYLPDLDKGLVIARASLNYYTINKKPRDYPAEIANKEKELSAEIEKSKQAIINLIRNQKFNNQIDRFVIKQIFNKTEKSITLDSLYQEMKIFKANEKKRFEEAIDQGLSYELIENEHSLFECSQQDFASFIKQTQTITSLGNQIAQLDKGSADYHQQRKKLKKELSETRQKRGKEFFFVGSGMKKGAKQFKQFCELYKLVALKRGRVLAEIKGIEREKIDARLLNYWALMLEKNDQHQLVLIPKEKAGSAYRKLEGEHDISGLSLSIHYFKSLTMRSLKKLCFGTQGNTFAREISIEIKKEHQKKYDQIQGAFSLSNFNTEKDVVNFYQAVLDTQFVKNNLDIDDFEDLEILINNKRISTLIVFETELEKICYRKRVLAGKELETYLREECDAQFMAITSYDLRKDHSRKGKDKQHTMIWKKFWSDGNQKNDYPVRLNPELKIIWRKVKESRVKKYGKESNNYNPDKNNRYLHPQFTLATTIIENALGKRLDLAFIDQDKLAEKIQEFNTDFNKEYATKPHEMYFYGIDRGNSELATLALVSCFTNKTNEFEQPIAEFAKFQVFRLKDDCLDYQEEYLCKGEPKQRKAISNLSYFIENSSLFEEKQTASIDLTTAKLIKGKIVENGDVLSYLRLKELSAKRRIYEYFSQSNIDTSKPDAIYFEDNEFRIHTLDNNNRAVIYYYRPDLDNIRSRKSIAEILNAYLEQLKIKNSERDILTIEKINHLRDAMAANMVGIIAHLFQKHPGIIALENLSKDELAGHFFASNENISRRLEWRLYNKFQNIGLVPPRLKESILLRQEQSLNQFGVIHFIPTENTSKNCPYCGEGSTKKKFEWEKDKHELRLFECTNSKCGFNSKTDRKHMDTLDNPDMVASFNIAKRGYEYAHNPPETDKKTRSNNHSKRRNNRTTKNNNNRNQINEKKQRKGASNLPFADLKNMLKEKE